MSRLASSFLRGLNCSVSLAATIFLITSVISKVFGLSWVYSYADEMCLFFIGYSIFTSWLGDIVCGLWTVSNKSLTNYYQNLACHILGVIMAFLFFKYLIEPNAPPAWRIVVGSVIINMIMGRLKFVFFRKLYFNDCTYLLDNIEQQLQIIRDNNSFNHVGKCNLASCLLEKVKLTLLNAISQGYIGDFIISFVIQKVAYGISDGVLTNKQKMRNDYDITAIAILEFCGKARELLQKHYI